MTYPHPIFKCQFAINFIKEDTGKRLIFTGDLNRLLWLRQKQEFVTLYIDRTWTHEMALKDKNLKRVNFWPILYLFFKCQLAINFIRKILEKINIIFLYNEDTWKRLIFTGDLNTIRYIWRRQFTIAATVHQLKMINMI